MLNTLWSSHRAGVGFATHALCPLQFGRCPPPCENVLFTADVTPSGPPENPLQITPNCHPPSTFATGLFCAFSYGTSYNAFRMTAASGLAPTSRIPRIRRLPLRRVVSRRRPNLWNLLNSSFDVLIHLPTAGRRRYDNEQLTMFNNGDYVKAIFNDDQSGQSEAMWVEVEHADHNARIVFGRLDNVPVVNTNLTLNQQLAVSFDQISEHLPIYAFSQRRLT